MAKKQEMSFPPFHLGVGLQGNPKVLSYFSCQLKSEAHFVIIQLDLHPLADSPHPSSHPSPLVHFLVMKGGQVLEIFDGH